MQGSTQRSTDERLRGLFPHLPMVPLDRLENIMWRRRLLVKCRGDGGFRRLLRRMCADDMVFWLSFAGWIIEQRDMDHAEQPFVPWDYQVTHMFGPLCESIEDSRYTRTDTRVKKSRDMGASWGILAVFLWYWLFRDGAQFLVVSRNADYVDAPNEPKCLFWRLMFMLERIPGFLTPRYSKTDMRLFNHETGSAITGEPTTGNVGRGSRCLAMLLDEFAAVDKADGYRALSSTRDTTNCRIFASTVGEHGAFSEVLRMPMREIALPWHLHPKKKVGLYRATPASVELIDAEYRHPEGYEFRMDGKLSSPWRDREYALCANKVEAAREIDMDEAESASTFFETSKIHDHIKRNARAPDMIGELIHNPQTGDPSHFEERHGGRLWLWFRPGSDGRPPSTTNYAVGADVATGTGSSNTAITVGAVQTGEKVACLVDPNIQPHESGVYAVALAKWFEGPDGGARLIWESPGPGMNFGIAVQRTGWARIWFKGDDRVGKFRGQRTSLTRPGWSPNDKDARSTVYREYARALNSGEFINRDALSLTECLDIVNDASGIVINYRAGTGTDPSGAKDNHGDRPTADALCWKIMQGGQRVVAPAPVVRVGSLAWRMKEHEAARRRAAEE